ncbi:hypothetical protein BH10CHL1_BH10CHL1_06950 [soil metagenome]
MVISTSQKSSWFKQSVQRFVTGLLWLEPIWVISLMPSLLLRDFFWDPWVQPWLIGSLLLFWPLRLLATRRLAPCTPLNRPIALLLLWSPVALWASRYPERSWDALGYLMLGIALYSALLNWSLTQRYPWLVVGGLGAIGLVLTATGPALLANIPSKLFLFSDDIRQSQPVNLFGLGETMNSNVLAGALLLPIPFLAALALRWDWSPKPTRRWLPLLLGLGALLMISTLILTQSRGAYLALAIGLIVVVLLRWPQAWLAMVVPTLAVVAVLAWNGTVLFAQPLGSAGSITSLSGRAEVWQRALYALRDFPLTGIGIGTFDLIIPKLYPYTKMSGANIPHAHNLFLQVGVDLGLPGLVAYSWLLVSAIRILIGILRSAGEVEQPGRASSGSARVRHALRKERKRCAALRWTLAAGGLGAFASLLIHGLVDAVAWGTKVAFLAWLLLALTALLALPPQNLVQPHREDVLTDDNTQGTDS